MSIRSYLARCLGQNRILLSLAAKLFCAALVFSAAAGVAPAQPFLNTVATFNATNGNGSGLFSAPIEAGR
jgi:hypothetical protein